MIGDEELALELFFVKDGNWFKILLKVELIFFFNFFLWVFDFIDEDWKLSFIFFFLFFEGFILVFLELLFIIILDFVLEFLLLSFLYFIYVVFLNLVNIFFFFLFWVVVVLSDLLCCL